MLQTKYVYNAASAVKADRPSMITETGAYQIQMVQVEVYETRNHASMIRFFNRDIKSGAGVWLELNVVKGNGEPSFGMDIFNSLLVCLGLEAVEAVPAKVRARSGEVMDGYRIKALEGKQIGIFLQREDQEYTDKNGMLRRGYRMNIFKFYRLSDMKTASEIIDNKSAEIFQKTLETLKDKPFKPMARPTTPDRDFETHQPESNAGRFDEGIPF